MPNLSYLRARIEAVSSAAGSTPSAAESSLSAGAVVGIAVGGSLILFAALTPVLIVLARWQDRRRAETAAMVAACCPISSSTFAAVTTVGHTRYSHNHPEEGTGEKAAPRRLRKKSVASELFDHPALASQIGAAETGGRQSVPVLPPVISRPGSLMNLGEVFAAAGARSDNSGDGAMVKKQRSPDKQRGYMIYQHRRKASWIDEDALHGPSISSNKNAAAKRNPSWMANFGRGLGRSLSRRFSVRRGAAGSSQLVGRSPTLPYTETRRRSGSASPSRSPGAEEKTAVTGENVRRVHDFDEGIATAPAAQHHNENQNHHYPNQAENTGTPRKAYTPRGGDSSPKRPSNAAMLHNNNANSNANNNHNIPGQRNTIAYDAAQRLAGGARVPVPTSRSMPASSVGPASPVGPRHHRRMTQSNTDAELQAILRRTAERLQDGSRSARRQTMVTPTAASSLPASPRRVPDDNTGGRNRASIPSTPSGGASGRYERGGFDSKTLSPAKSQKSAPAALSERAELDGRSLQVPGASSVLALSPQPQDQSQTPRRHTRQISQLSQISMLSEADSLVASRRGSQADLVQTPPSSPSRAGPATLTSPANPSQPHHPQARQRVAVPETQRPFSMASTESSALSTLYSEEETPAARRSPPAHGGRAPRPTTLMERQAMQQALSACDAFAMRSSQMSLDGVGGPKRFPLGGDGASPRPLRVRKGTLGQAALEKAAFTTTGTASLEQQRQRTKVDPRATTTMTPKTTGAPLAFTIHALGDDAANDPFTVATPSPPASAPAIPTRLSKLFSALPAKGGDSRSGDVVVPNSPSPRSRHSPSSSRNQAAATTITEEKDQTPTRSSHRRVVVPPPHVLRAATGSEAAAPAVVGGVVGTRHSSSTSSRASQVSEGGLSSVYESYAYRDSSYGDDVQTETGTTATATTTARNSVVTLFTATDPTTTAATSPTRGVSSSSSSNGRSPSGRESRCGFQGRDALSSSRQQQRSGTVPRPAATGAAAGTITITVKSPTASPPRNRHLRAASSSSSHHSAASDESSRYSQDDEAANTVPPLLLPCRAAAGSAHSFGRLGHGLGLSHGRALGRGHHRSGAQHNVSITTIANGSANAGDNSNSNRYTRVASAVAELRRMNSQVSSVSTASNSTAAAASTRDHAGKKENNNTSGASPTLPDLRGGGFSPGRGGARSGGRNYLALGGSGAAATAATATQETSGGDDVAVGDLGGKGGQEKEARREDRRDEKNTTAAVAARNGAIDNRGSYGGNSSSGGLRTHANKLVWQQQEAAAADKRASVESLGLYDAQGFLKGSPQRQSFLEPVLRR